MKLFSRTLGWLPLSVIAVVAGMALEAGGALSQSKTSVTTMPPNYRALVARYVLTQLNLDRPTLNTAMISQPFGKWGGLFRGGTIPTVCVSIDTKNMLGMAFKGYFLFTIENGRAERLEAGNALVDTCPGMSPFYEVKR